MLIYILKSGACLAILLFFYKMLLEKENMHVFKRFYLLGSLIFALIIPTIVFTEYVEVAPATYSATPNVVTTNLNPNVPVKLESDVLDIAPILWGIYFLGMLFFGIKFLKNLFQIFKRIRRNPKYKNANFIQVLLTEKMPPHTFFRYIFLNKSKFESNEIPKEVLLHEETHAGQRHSWDVVFIELLQVVFWVNPLIHFFKKAIKLNHEFLADRAVLNKDVDTVTYQNTLLSFLSSESAKKYQPMLPNAINYSSIKKRFTVMKTQTSKKSVFLRSVLLLPLLAILLLGFSETKMMPIENEAAREGNTLAAQQKATQEMVATYNSLAKKYNKQPKESRVVPLGDLQTLEYIYGRMTEMQKENAQPFPECPPQEGATKEQVSEYNTLAKKYNAMMQLDDIRIEMSDVERLEYLHSLMTEEQRANAEPFPDFPEPPPPPEAPQELEEEMIEMEQEMERQEKAMVEQEGAMLEKERTMKERELAMKEKEHAMQEQEHAMEKHEIEMERLGRYSHFPAPPNLAYMVDQKPLTKELKKLVDNFEKKRKLYQNAVKDYLNKGRGNENKIYGMYENLMEAYDEYKVMAADEGVFAQPSPAFAPKVRKGETSNIPPPPPPTPKSPLEHIEEMAKKNAVFYHEGKKITSDEAIEILKKNNRINIETRHTNKKRPEVRLSTDPIIIEN